MLRVVVMPFMPLSMFLYITGAPGCRALTMGTVLTPRGAGACIVIRVFFKLVKAFLTAETVDLSVILRLDGLISVYLLFAYGVKDLLPYHNCGVQ
jgi:hypothetical protein